MKRALLTLSLFIISNICFSAPVMNQDLLEKTVKSVADKSNGEKGIVRFTYNKVKLLLISDVKHDRMRIIAAVKKFENLTKKQINSIMESNFHKSLDARYAVSNGILYSAYIHPLSSLNKKQIKSAMLQVSNLAKSFGSEYSSGMLSFGGKEKVKKSKIIDGAI